MPFIIPACIVMSLCTRSACAFMRVESALPCSPVWLGWRRSPNLVPLRGLGRSNP